ncbi:assimilatory nitrite reductase (NAD(P)H) large subunit precursor [Anoxybacillus vitaminiphilus]|uniref:Assimilatory nitrite reductase (NAD(P)H) large subunit n=1 Tax=Paranoxybacillus vitaminiphilus TaxID=581036 RepID=A0A327YAT5_9BACL|nr:nitrite reductase large subunit NirB [Anoxybacillus vitaminiphilus]RAK18248.1 assimilatory nitrite reductase (NAD(P)H) large subunit precursor [Anoxybacillus vitaminiphilus]
MKRKQLVLIGNGMAGVRCIEEILKIDRDLFEITIFGSEPYPNYNRILLSTVLQGDTSIDDITMNDWEWYEKNNIHLFVGETVVKIDKEQQLVFTDKGRVAEYDELIIATGSKPFILPIPGSDKQGVTAFRDIKDCEMLMEYAKKYKKAVVIGGGLLGLEAARGLLNLGMEVNVVHIWEHLMERQLDPTASKLLQREMEKQGMKFLLQKETAEIIGDDRVEGLRFKDGTEIAADLVVMAVGIRPNVELARQSGIAVNRGIIVNDYLETSVPHIYAVGECAEHRGIVYGLVAPLYEQGKVLAEKLCGIKGRTYTGSVVSTQLKVSGVDVFSAGEFMDQEGTSSIKVYDEFRGIYKKVVIRDEKMIGAVLFGDTSDGRKLLDMIQKNENISESFQVSFFRPSSNQSNKSMTAEMADNEVVCGCNGVTKGTICKAIVEKGLKTVEQVRDCTNASRSCGGCKGLVAELLEYTIGEEFDRSVEKETICSCTTLSREEVIEEIKSKNLKYVKEVMNVLGWKNEEGCSKCRPALNYYLSMLYPTEYQDEYESRFVNERLHANIQADGTYSVVPRMYGGVTTAEQLRKIADVAEKYNVPMIKLTGGQRIDLLGIKKEDLPKVWAELDMPSGYAYAKALRTVKTCVGKQFCRFGTQDSTQLGIDLEKKLERLNTPHKVKMAVSACPRNCAESGIKDVGIVGVDGGWEIYVGGNGGTHLRAGDLLCTVQTEEEVIEITGAFLQYYRESANYLERTSKWVERVGLERIREVIFDVDNRKQLLVRLEEALVAAKDPWKEIVENKEIQEKLFRDLKVPVNH